MYLNGLNRAIEKTVTFYMRSFRVEFSKVSAVGVYYGFFFRTTAITAIKWDGWGNTVIVSILKEKKSANSAKSADFKAFPAKAVKPKPN